MGDRATLEIKGTTISTVLMIPHAEDLATLKAYLSKKFGQRAAFFEGEPAVLDLQQVPNLADIDGLIALIRRFGLVPIAIKHGTEAQEALAKKAFLAILEADEAEGMAESDGNPLDHPLSTGLAVSAIYDAIQSTIAFGPDKTDAGKEKTAATHSDEGIGRAPKVLTAEGLLEEKTCRRSMVVSKPLRSGQQVYAKEADLIVLAPVSFGAEVIADGNIHVYSTLRGRAVAGMKGDRSARIYALTMQAELVSIAGVYRTFETPLPKALQERPVQVILNDSDQIIVELIDS